MKRKYKSAAHWKPDGLYLRDCYVGHGMLQYTCLAANSPEPLGFVWANPTSNDFGQTVLEVVDIYVSHRFRRLGIGTFIIRQCLEMYGLLRTGTGTKEGGAALMKATGWKQNKATGDWYLRGRIKILGH